MNYWTHSPWENLKATGLTYAKARWEITGDCNLLMCGLLTANLSFNALFSSLDLQTDRAALSRGSMTQKELYLSRMCSDWVQNKSLFFKSWGWGLEEYRINLPSSLFHFKKKNQNRSVFCRKEQVHAPRTVRLQEENGPEQIWRTALFTLLTTPLSNFTGV